MGADQGVLAEALGVQRKHVSELCNNRGNVPAATAPTLARGFGNSSDFWLPDFWLPDFWLNVQRRSELWKAMHDPKEQARIKRAKPLKAAA